MDDLFTVEDSNGGPPEGAAEVVEPAADPMGGMMDEPVVEVEAEDAAPVSAPIMAEPEVAPNDNKLQEYEEKRAAELVTQQEEEKEKIAALRAAAVEWLDEEKDKRAKVCE